MVKYRSRPWARQRKAWVWTKCLKILEKILDFCAKLWPPCTDANGALAYIYIPRKKEVELEMDIIKAWVTHSQK